MREGGLKQSQGGCGDGGRRKKPHIILELIISILYVILKVPAVLKK